jgi:hypothetical protein
MLQGATPALSRQVQTLNFDFAVNLRREFTPELRIDATPRKCTDTIRRFREIRDWVLRLST